MQTQTLSQSRWRRETVIWIGLALVALIVFRDSTVDLWAAKLFYHPEKYPDVWWEENNWLWNFFYHGAPILTGVLLGGCLLILGGQARWAWAREYKRGAIYIFLVIALGPGLVINSFFKPSWGRPRPREVHELGGLHTYKAVWQPDWGAPGKSFPCGHCSVGFSFGAVAWVLRERRPRWALGVFGFSVILGLGMGVGRIAAGGHFLSDAVFGGLICYFLSTQLAHFYLNSSSHPSRQAKPWVRRLGFVGLAGLTALALLVASPFHRRVDLRLAAEDGVRDLILITEGGDLDISASPAGGTAFLLKGEVKGFGFPGNEVLSSCRGGLPHGDINEVVCVVQKRGFFTDFESKLTLELARNQWRNVEIRHGKGDVRVIGEPLPPQWLY